MDYHPAHKPLINSADAIFLDDKGWPGILLYVRSVHGQRVGGGRGVEGGGEGRGESGNLQVGWLVDHFDISLKRSRGLGGWGGGGEDGGYSPMGSRGEGGGGWGRESGNLQVGWLVDHFDISLKRSRGVWGGGGEGKREWEFTSGLVG